MRELPPIEQAIYGGQDSGGYRFLAKSTGFRDEWLPEAEKLCTGFGERPAGVACPRAVFARPFAGNHVAIVQAADRGVDDAGRPGALGFHLLVLPAELYGWLGGDPFFLADRFSPSWEARGVLSPLPSPEEPAPRRTVAQVQKVLDVPHSATLLGGAQALVDGGKLAFERSAPDEGLVRGLWTLLPTSTRRDLWPATFAFGNALQFDMVLMPRLDAAMFGAYLREEQAGDYPEGRYELSLQTAAESGDQDALDGLFSRRSYKETKRLALFLVAVALLLPLLMALINRTKAPKEQPDKDRPTPQKKETAPPGKIHVGRALELPPKEDFFPLNGEERRALSERLQELAERLHIELPATASGVALVLASGSAPLAAGPLGAASALEVDDNALASPEELLAYIGLHLQPDNHRLHPLSRFGPVERQLRALAGIFSVERYSDRGLTPPELVERLQEKVLKDRGREGDR